MPVSKKLLERYRRLNAFESSIRETPESVYIKAPIGLKEVNALQAKMQPRIKYKRQRVKVTRKTYTWYGYAWFKFKAFIGIK
jgi:hypothetical protein